MKCRIFNSISGLYALDSTAVTTKMSLLCFAAQILTLQPQGPQPTRLLCPWGFSRKEYWSGVPCPPPGDLSNPTQGLNPGLLHCRHILYHLCHHESLRILEWVSPSLLQGNFLTQESNQSLLHCRRILFHLSYLGSPKMSLLLLLPLSRFSRVRLCVAP